MRVGTADPDTAPRGPDLRFFASDGVTPLPFDVPSVPRAATQFDAWVRVPDLRPAGDGVLWAYWGDPDLADGSDPDQVWPDTEVVAVWHLDDERDATPNRLDGAFTSVGVVEAI